jgi:TPR repeat protein
MNQFTVGDRCLVHRLESEAGLLLNGQHVTVAKAIIQNGRFKCKFDDGTVKQIKPCNLQITHGHDWHDWTIALNETVAKIVFLNKLGTGQPELVKVVESILDSNPSNALLLRNSEQVLQYLGQHGSDIRRRVKNEELLMNDDRVNQTKEKCETDASSNLNKKEDQIQKEDATDDDDKKEAPPPSPATHQQEQQQEKEECSICLDVLPNDTNKYARATCCGKGMHDKCREDMIASKMSLEQKNRCVMCRTKYPASNTKEGKKKTIKRLRKWVKKDKAWAQSMLGQCYRDGINGVPLSMKRAAALFNLASEQGDALATYQLGCLYRDGDGVDKDEKHALKLFTLAADQRFAIAQYSLGLMYDHGQGVDKDKKRAVELYTLAADQGHVSAQYNLGCIYANGKSVDKSLTKAKEWFTKAAAQGHERAINTLKRLDAAEGRTTTTSSTVNSNTTFCSYCSKPEPTNTKFNRCKGCRSVAYCNRECQIKHWKTKPNSHKKQCKKLAAAFKNKKNAK